MPLYHSTSIGKAGLKLNAPGVAPSALGQALVAISGSGSNYVLGWTPFPEVTSGAIASALGYVPANKAGDDFGGPISIEGTTTLGNTGWNGSMRLTASGSRPAIAGYLSICTPDGGGYSIFQGHFEPSASFGLNSRDGLADLGSEYSRFRDLKLSRNAVIGGTVTLGYSSVVNYQKLIDFSLNGVSQGGIYQAFDAVALKPALVLGALAMQGTANGHVAIGTTGQTGMVGIANGLGLAVANGMYLGFGKTSDAVREQDSAWADGRFYRVGPGAIKFTGQDGTTLGTLQAGEVKGGSGLVLNSGINGDNFTFYHAGIVRSSANLFTFQNNGGTPILSINSTGNLAVQHGADGTARFGLTALAGGGVKVVDPVTSALSTLQANAIDFGDYGGYPRKIVSKPYGLTICANSGIDGTFDTGNNLLTLLDKIALSWSYSKLAMTGSGATQGVGVFADSGLSVKNFVGNADAQITASRITLNNVGRVAFTNGFADGTVDLAVRRVVGGTLEINNGTAGQYRDLVARAATLTGSASSTVLTVKGASGNPTNLQEWQVDNGTARSYMDAQGQFTTYGLQLINGATPSFLIGTAATGGTYWTATYNSGALNWNPGGSATSFNVNAPATFSGQLNVADYQAISFGSVTYPAKLVSNGGGFNVHSGSTGVFQFFHDSFMPATSVGKIGHVGYQRPWEYVYVNDVYQGYGAYPIPSARHRMLAVGQRISEVGDGAGNWQINITETHGAPVKLGNSTQGVVLLPAASATPAANGDLAFEATSNTSLTVKYKGSDGVVRSVALTLS